MSALPAPSATDPFAGLEPAAVWQHFARLCAIPRPSKHEARLRDTLRAWAVARGLAAEVDAAGNLIIAKAAAPGCDGAPGVVLQSHLDMVCQKNEASAHDFLRDPIVPLRQGDWLEAPGTTLGADNGIGVALALAVLQADDLPHGPLEVLLTVDEEAGMGGAHGLEPARLRGRLMLNLDTEEWGEFYLGCAGGLDVNVQRKSAPLPLPPGHVVRRIELRGLRGGHSGIDIHTGRGNAIKLLVRVLRGLESERPLHLCALHGGTARNALAREAWADVALPAQDAARLGPALTAWQDELCRELRGVDDALTLRAVPAQASAMLAPAEQQIWLASLHAAPHGVRRMSVQVPGVVETSNNLGIVELGPDGGRCNFMVRSLIDQGSRALGDEIASLFALSGTPVEQDGHYPGWAPNPASPLLALCQAAYRREFQAESTVQVIHAGLECGIIAAKYPDMDIVSFGPTIRGAHAPGERVEIASVARCWRLLTAILAASAQRAAP